MKEIRLSKKQKEVVALMKKYDPVVMDLRDGCWFTGGHGIRIDRRVYNSLRKKGVIGIGSRLSELGKSIDIS